METWAMFCARMRRMRRGDPAAWADYRRVAFAQWLISRFLAFVGRFGL